MATVTQQLLDLIRTTNNCTDYRAAQLLGVTDASVSRWRRGHNHMAPAQVTKACKLTGETNVARWQVMIGAEREVGPDGDFWRDLKADMLKAEAGEKPAKDGTLSVFLRHLRTRTAAVILSAVTLLGLSGFSPENTAFAASSGANNGPGEYTLCEVRRMMSRWLERLFWLPLTLVTLTRRAL